MSHALNKIKAAGFVVELEGNDLVISPFSRLTPSQMTFLKSHKAEIIDELKAERAVNDNYHRDPFDDRHYCHECRNLINGRCVVQHFRPVDDRPRRCIDYAAIAGFKASQVAELKAEQTANEILKRLVICCYTPNGYPIEVEATSPEHAEWLQRMNPKPPT